MKRRGFLAFLGFGASAAASNVSLAAAESDESAERGVWATAECMNNKCGEDFTVFIDLTGPLLYPNQCSRCFGMLDWSSPETVDKIAEWNQKYAKWNGWRLWVEGRKGR